MNVTKDGMKDRQLKEEPDKVRELGILTVVDRVIQQAIAQILTPIYESQFSELSYGFRPGRYSIMILMGTDQTNQLYKHWELQESDVGERTGYLNLILKVFLIT